MRTALITGALGGIGVSLCEEFRRAGYFVIATDRRDGTCACNTFLKIDVRDLYHSEAARTSVRESVLPLIADTGLHVLVNNAASQILKRTDDILISDWDETLQTNLIAPFLFSQVFLPEIERAKGSIINIASIHSVATKPGFVCYATSKAALVGLTRAMAVDLGPRVRVNAINPAATATPMLLAGFEGKSKEFDELAKKHPLERIAQPWEVAKTAIFLASPDAAFITGACIHIDGGIGGRLHDPV
ncbi:MAG: SDR family NAD(P)-dependent oxidoreductase [Terrimicrobiaceae bacterium]|nr:SDR family NAD(P)-dependent oxidoreductase [Terrimicrobiaceae bacterium]